MKFQLCLLLLTACVKSLNAQTPEFYFNGAADVIMRYQPRGSGGRALVHDDGNIFTINYGGDFTGGTRIGNAFNIANDGTFRVNGKLTFLSNGYFGIGTHNPEVPLSVYGMSNFFPVRSETGDGDVRMFSIGAGFTNQAFISNGYPIVLKTGAGDQPLILDVARVGIGTVNPGERLSVNGKIRAHEIKVETANWPDYVFEQDYKILGLTALESYIKANKHLPDMPSAKEVEANGVALGEMNKLLLKKVEELTLHLIKKDKQLAKETQINVIQERKIASIQNDFLQLKQLILKTKKNK